MQEKQREIREWLCDEESKEIYENACLFEDTYDYRYIQKTVDRYVSECSDKKWLYLSNDLRKALTQYKSVIVAGAGQKGKAAARMLIDQGISVSAFIDNGTQGITVLEEAIPILNPKDAEYKDTGVLISPVDTGIVEDLKFQLKEYGVSEKDVYVLNQYVEGGVYLDEKQYFDETIIRWTEKEVFVDCGVFDLGTSIQFVKQCEKHKVKDIKIYAFEADRNNYRNCLHKMDLFGESNCKITLENKGVWSSCMKLSFSSNGQSSMIKETGGSDSINVVTLDSAIHEKVTFIKMDIEGAEQEALKGAKHLIQTYRPKLAICIYHKPEDLTEIPLCIKSLVPDYKLYVRHYSNNTGELVLYAVA